MGVIYGGLGISKLYLSFYQKKDKKISSVIFSILVIKLLALYSLEMLYPDLLETLQAFISGKTEINSNGQLS
jgi:hypothetical protein